MHFGQVITVRNSSYGKVMFLQASVILSTGEGVSVSGAVGCVQGVSDQEGVYIPLGRHHPWSDPQRTDSLPPGRQSPWQTPQADTPSPRRPLQRTVRILLECILGLDMTLRYNSFPSELHVSCPEYLLTDRILVMSTNLARRVVH